MHAFLIVSQSIDKSQFTINRLAVENKAKKLPFILQKIEDARELKKFIKFSFSEKTAIVIENIDTATHEALNAFLKNLEEPNKNLIYILTATNLNEVLPTIVSRCEIIKSTITNNQSSNNTQITNFLNSKFSQRFEIVGKIKDRNEAMNFVRNLIYLDKTRSEFSNMENYLKTLRNLKLNGNVALQLTNLVARMESHG